MDPATTTKVGGGAYRTLRMVILGTPGTVRGAKRSDSARVRHLSLEKEMINHLSEVNVENAFKRIYHDLRPWRAMRHQAT
ncbi:hypothetical protein [Roseospira marina]|uniref:hypothetical protein n=1 Tax=Roseospira marina TaxID=140057 RepID=UPI00147945F3|nr:hypothetical protein [Roseospira marina]MBB4312452.1 hypothetical protein [Roseospira marina]MBB5085532.1 hypothetical protein [Roseospira marina]